MANSYSLDRNIDKYVFGFVAGFFVIAVVVLLVSDDIDNFISNNMIPFSAICLLVCGFGLGMLFIFLKNWLFPSTVYTDLKSQLYERANLYRKESYIVLLSIFILTIGAAVVFYKASSFAREDLISLYVPKPEALAKIRGAIGPEKFEKIFSDVIESSVKGSAAWVPFALMTALRVGDIAVASFLTFILAKLYRYNLRLSAFYYSRADALELCDNPSFSKVNRERLPHLMDANTDFGAELTTIAQSVAQVADALKSKRQEAQP